MLPPSETFFPDMTEIPSGLRLGLSLLLTLGILGASLFGLLETHAYSASMVPKSAFLACLEFACPILSIIGYISPVGSVVSMARNSDVSEFPVQVVLAQMTQNIASLSYGILRNNQPFLISAFIGLVFELIWLTVWYAIGRRRTKTILWRKTNPTVALISSIVCMALMVTALNLLGPDIVGTIACVLTLILCISPLSNLGQVIRTRNSASIPVAMTTVMMVVNVAWTMYGIILEDSYVYLPSLFGFVVTVFQLIVTAWCSEYLFYDLAFLQWAFESSMEVNRSHSPGTIFSARSLSEDQLEDK